MAIFCKHLSAIRDVLPSAPGCEECLKTGDPWLHLRICRTCGHVGCCDQSPNKHATKHFRATQHPIIEAYDPPEGWGWCYVDEVMFDLSGRQTPHLGPIPRFYRCAARRLDAGASAASRERQFAGALAQASALKSKLSRVNASAGRHRPWVVRR